MEPDIKGKIVELSKKEEGEIIELRRDFHRYPELGFAEKRTAERAALEMESLGLSVQTGIAGTGVVGGGGAPQFFCGQIWMPCP